MKNCFGQVVKEHIVINSLLRIRLYYLILFNLKKNEKSEQIFHGCFTKNREGTNRLIEKGKACIKPTSKPFWKYTEDVVGCVRTRSQEKNKKKVKSRDYDKYFKQKDIQRWLERDNSEVVILKESDEFYVVS